MEEHLLGQDEYDELLLELLESPKVVEQMIARLRVPTAEEWEVGIERCRDHRPLEEKYRQEAYHVGVPKWLHDRFLDRRYAGETPDEIARELSVFRSKRDRHIPQPVKPRVRPLEADECEAV